MGTVHPGEAAVQRQAGVHERSSNVMAQVVRPFMPDPHIELFEKLPTVWAGALGGDGRPWATVLAGEPGFLQAPDPRHLRIAALPAAGDPVQLRPGARVGLLGLEPHTRRRNRMNGTVLACGEAGFEVHVDQSFGNCPKYIQARVPQRVHRGTPPPPRALGPDLPPEALALIRASDTVFIASATPPGGGWGDADGVDVSHRGGRPGFVGIGGEPGRTVLDLPDFQGNNFFNTLGNLAAFPWAGLLFVDFSEGHLLHVSGRADVLWQGPEVAAFKGALRVLRVTVSTGVWRPHALPLRWSDATPSPHLDGTGSWL